jgi:hypothetical protein
MVAFPSASVSRRGSQRRFCPKWMREYVASSLHPKKEKEERKKEELSKAKKKGKNLLTC